MKERLTGAIILVALMVLLIPELLTGPVRSIPRAAALGSQTGEPPLRSYTIDLAEEARARSGSQANGPQQPAPLLAAASSETAAPQASPATPPAPTAPPVETSPRSPAPPPAKPATLHAGTARTASAATSATAAAPSSTGSKAWTVQLGSFASRENAERLAQQVRSQGFQVSVSQGTSGRRLYHVRVGAAHDRAGALALAQKLRALGHSGTVVPKQAGT